MHHQRHPPADRADDRAPRRRPRRRRDEGVARRRVSPRARPSRPRRRPVAGPLTMEKIPILRMGRFLLVSIQVDLHDRMAMQLQEDLTEQIVKTGAKGVLIDISALELVDSFIGRMLNNLTSMSRILDAETVVVGMRPAVAMTLVELGLELGGLRTALNVGRGMELLGGARFVSHKG